MDNQCILCEFINESDSIAIGYRAWLLDEVDEDKLQNIMKQKKQLPIKWPSCGTVEPGK